MQIKKHQRDTITHLLEWPESRILTTGEDVDNRNSDSLLVEMQMQNKPLLEDGLVVSYKHSINHTIQVSDP